MSKFVKYEQCPRCVSRGADSRGDNVGVYIDGSKHCYSCGFHQFPKTYVKQNVNESLRTEDKKVLPYDFSRDIPARAWKWLLQYGLGYKYWEPYCGYSEKDERLIITVGTPMEFSQGRYMGEDTSKRKWYCYGDAHKTAHMFGNPETSNGIVLVEDVISAHKVGQITSCISLFGTNIFDSVVSTLRLYRKPVTMWLDHDQQTHARKRAVRLSMLTGCEVNFVFTKQDAKELSSNEIKEILKINLTN